MEKIYDFGQVTQGFIILGYYSNLTALQATITSPAVGDAYGIGSIAPYNIYVWDGSTWVDNGNLKGESGLTGPTGPAGQSAYAAAQTGGYSGTQSDFYADLAVIGGLAAALEELL